MFTKTIENVALPMSIFSGAYNSVWECAIDNELTGYDEHEPEGRVNWSETFENIGEEYTGIIPANYEDYGIISAEYHGYYSPREYNFSTDQLFLNFTINPTRVYKTILRNKEKFCEILKAAHQSRDGFCSFYEWQFSKITAAELLGDVYFSDFLRLCEYLHAGEEQHPDFYHTTESEVYDYITGNSGIVLIEEA